MRGMPHAKNVRPRRGYRSFDRVEVALGFTMIVMVALATFAAYQRRATYAALVRDGVIDERCSPDIFQRSVDVENDRLAQIAQAEPIRTDGDLTQWRTPEGLVWTPPHARGSFVAGGFYKRHAHRWTRIDGAPTLVPVRAGDVVIDCGAHVGESTWHALAFGARLVVSIEPDPANVRALRRNLSREIDSGKVIVIEKGVYDRETTLTFLQRANSWAGRFEEHDHEHATANDTQDLAVTTIDRIVSELQLGRVDFIKMDIEGSEVPALRGAVQTLRAFKPILAVGTYHRAEDLAGIPKAVADARTDYRITPSRCLGRRGRVFPHLLLFH